MSGLQRALGLELSIIQAPMAGVQDRGLAVAVCNAGGLGSLPCAMLELAASRRGFTALRAATDRPFNLDFFRHGSGDFSPLWSGHNESGCRAVPAAELTRGLAGA